MFIIEGINLNTNKFETYAQVTDLKEAERKLKEAEQDNWIYLQMKLPKN